MEAENYLAGGYGTRLAIQSREDGWAPLETLAKVWQPSRLKGIQVGREFGTPFLAATQVFDLRPTPRKWLSIDRTDSASDRFVAPGMMLVTCSGSVGRATLAFEPHRGVLISHDLLRVEANADNWRGWIYAYFRSPQARGMMSAAQYGHIIKHLEVSHLNALPIPLMNEQIRRAFGAKVQKILDKRNDAVAEQAKAEIAFADAVGAIPVPARRGDGFTVPASAVFGQRRRLEAAFHNPQAVAILNHFHTSRRTVQPLREVCERIWWMTRFKRVFGEQGVPYLSADELFSLNPPVSKRVLLEQADNPQDFFVKAGWIVMARSGQVYGLNGSVALMTKHHETVFLSDDLIRIIVRTTAVRSGYLYTALGHPTLGRPLVIRHAYGTSIPHLDPVDVGTFPLVRLRPIEEGTIADHAERAVELRAEADALENEVAAEAEVLIDAFLAGDRRNVVAAL